MLRQPNRCGLILWLALLLAGCASTDWDPSRRVETGSGHIFDQTAPGRTAPVSIQPLRDHNGIAIGDDDDRPIPQDRIDRGTGSFVSRVSRPEVDTTPGDVTLNFENTDIREVVKVILGDLLKVNYVLDPQVQGTATLHTGRPLRRELLLPTLETLLRMNNAALVDRGDRYEVVAISNAMRGNLAPQLGQTERPLPRGYGVQIIPLRYIGAREMANILEPLAPEGSLVRVDSLRNLLLIAASGPEMINLIDTIEVFDVDWMAGLSVGFFTLEYAKAKDVIGQLNELLSDDDGGSFSGMFRFIPVESANALLVVSPQADYLQRMKDWIQRLDFAEASGSGAQRLYVYRVKHGDAENLASILSALFTGEGRATPARSVGTLAPGQREATIGEGGNSGTRATSHSQINLSNEVGIVADTVNNSLLIRASARDYSKILDALKQLDIVPLQVLVEATIVEITLTGSLRHGMQWQFFNQETPTRSGGYIPDVSLSQGDTARPSPQLPGFNWSTVLRPNTVRATLSALASDGLVNVLSSPSVMVMDNQEAKIQVGEQVPVATMQQQGTSETDRIINQIQYRDTGVMLTVRPKVTPGGLVQMDIQQEVSTVAERGGELNSPSFRTRNITSNVAVRSNQSVVLGGLIQDNREDGRSGVPGLYRAPILGGLFGSTNRKAERTELVVILTPRVIASDSDIESVTADFRAKVHNLNVNF